MSSYQQPVIAYIWLGRYSRQFFDPNAETVWTFSEFQYQTSSMTLQAKFLSSNVLRMHINEKWKCSMYAWNYGKS